MVVKFEIKNCKSFSFYFLPPGLSLYWHRGASDTMTLPTHGTSLQHHLFPYFLIKFMTLEERNTYPIPTPDYCVLKNPGSIVIGPVPCMDLSLTSGGWTTSDWCYSDHAKFLPTELNWKVTELWEVKRSPIYWDSPSTPKNVICVKENNLNK